MAVKRISDINIKNNNSLFTAIYGNVTDGEFFIDNDLKTYSLEQQLYLYLKSEGYTVLFYKQAAQYNVYSYSREDVRTFLYDFEQNNTQSKQYIAKHINSPFKQSRLNRRNNNPETENKQEDTNAIQEQSDDGKYQNTFYRTHKTTGLINDLRRLFGNNESDKKVAYIFSDPDNCNLGDEFESYFKSLNNTYAKDDSKHKIFLLYHYPNAQLLIEAFDDSSKNSCFFFKNFYKQLFVKDRKLNVSKTYFISLPDKEEITNLLNLRRLKERFDVFSLILFDKLVSRLVQKRETLQDLYTCDINKEIEKAAKITAWDELKLLIGIEPIVKQLNNLVEVLKEGNIGVKFRPHVVFKGAPGTGKTTVARLFSQILQEEGVLPSGHFVPTKPKDFLAGHEGGTREKSDKVCESAKGGVLFIDEAYGIIKREGGVSSEIAYGGTDVCEVLLTFMEDDDSLLIIAGYEEEINEFIQKGNKGFPRRFIDELHITFKDYPLEVLYEILELNIKKSGKRLTENAKNVFKKVLAQKYQNKTKEWGNAGEVENLFGTLRLSTVGKKEIDVADLPEKWKQSVELEINYTNPIQDLNELIGLGTVKAKVIELTNFIKVQNERKQKGKKAVSISNHLVFTGNPGTGKTTVARIIADIYKEIGVLKKGHLVETDRSGLVAGYVGQTAAKTNMLIDSALDGILFIDEAYSLVSKHSNDFGNEAIATLLKRMEDERDRLIVIVAGYTNEMADFINTNPGLKSRFPDTNYIEFPDYSAEELYQIFELISNKNDYLISTEAQTVLKDIFAKSISVTKRDSGNGRFVRNTFEAVIQRHASRLVKNPNIESDTLLAEDISKEYEQPTQKQDTDVRIPHIILPSLKYFTDNSVDSYAKALGLIKIDNGQAGEGTGFLISSNGYILTCAHCVFSSKEISFNYNGEDVETSLIYKNENLDIAILKIARNNLPYFVISDSTRQLKRGTQMGLLAYPKGSKMGTQPSYTSGGISKYESGDYFTDAGATHGSSGGAFFKIDDGIVYGVLKGGFGAEGANINVATDIRTLFKQNDIEIEFE